MSEEYSQVIRITEEETSHPGFPHAMAKARLTMEPTILDVEQGEPACDILRAAAEKLPYWPPIAPPFSFSAEIIGQLFGRHEVREVEHGVYSHTFTPEYWPFRMVSETASLRDGPFIPATYHVISQRAVRLALKAKAEERKQKRRRKIVRKQKRAAIRRKKRGLA